MGQATALTIRGRSVVSLRAKLPLLAEGAPESWVEMAYESEWKGHHAGEFAFTRAALESIVARFDADENPLPVTYGHPDHSAGKPTPAGGWIREMQVRDGSEGAELWGRVEWTETAAQHIRAGEYRYCSVVVDFAPIDRATGESAGLAEMYELALTNSPFLPGMTPITLSRVGAPARSTRSLAMATTDPQKMFDDAYKAAGLKKADATPEKLIAMLQAAAAYLKALAGSDAGAPPDIAAAGAELSRFVQLSAIGLADEAMEMPAEEVAEAAGAMAIGKLVDATGLDEAAVLAALDANMDAIVALLAGTPAAGMSSDAPAAALSRVTTELAAVRTRETALARELNSAKESIAAFERAAAEAAEAKKEAVEGQRERFTKLARHDLAATSEIWAENDAVPTSNVVTRDKAAPPKSAAKSEKGATGTDPVSLSRAVAKGLGLKGEAAEKFSATWLANHSNTDA